MEKTKFWVVIEYSGFSYSSGYNYNIVGICLSKTEAEFYCGKKSLENKQNRELHEFYSPSIKLYKYEETSLMDFVDKDSKIYKKFIENKKQEIMEQIQKKEECKSKDICDIECLKNKLHTL